MEKIAPYLPLIIGWLMFMIIPKDVIYQKMDRLTNLGPNENEY